MVFCSIDALLTLIHLEYGGRELVPTMDWMLSISQEAFLGVKLLLTGLGAWFLAAHENFSLGRWSMRFVFFVYFFLMIYHLYLIFLRSSGPYFL